MARTVSVKTVMEPWGLTCGTCGGEATAYPRPLPGVVYCPICSPAWLKSFAEWSTAQFAKGQLP